jgi:hypothetical protein
MGVIWRFPLIFLVGAFFSGFFGIDPAKLPNGQQWIMGWVVMSLAGAWLWQRWAIHHKANLRSDNAP